MSNDIVYVRERIGGKDDHLIARILNGEVMSCQPVGLNEMNVDIDACIKYLQKIKSAIEESRSARPV